MRSNQLSYPAIAESVCKGNRKSEPAKYSDEKTREKLSVPGRGTDFETSARKIKFNDPIRILPSRIYRHPGHPETPGRHYAACGPLVGNSRRGPHPFVRHLPDDPVFRLHGFSLRFPVSAGPVRAETPFFRTTSVLPADLDSVPDAVVVGGSPHDPRLGHPGRNDFDAAAFLAMFIIVQWMVRGSRMQWLLAAYLFTVVAFTYLSALVFYDYEVLVNPKLHGFGNALWWAWMNVTSVGAAIFPVTAVGKVVCVLLPSLGMMSSRSSRPTFSRSMPRKRTLTIRRRRFEALSDRRAPRKKTAPDLFRRRAFSEDEVPACYPVNTSMIHHLACCGLAS